MLIEVKDINGKTRYLNTLKIQMNPDIGDENIVNVETNRGTYRIPKTEADRVIKEQKTLTTVIRELTSAIEDLASNKISIDVSDISQEQLDKSFGDG